MLYFMNRSAMMVLTLAACLTVSAQCDPLEVDFGGEPWGLAPDGEETFFDSAEISVAYTDDVHLLVPSVASEVVPDTPLDAPIDSVVILMILLVDSVSGDTLDFAEAGLSYECNNLGDCTDPCTFLGGQQYCARFSGVPTIAGDFMLSLEVQVWATVFGFPLATPFSFSGFPFPIAGETNSVDQQSQAAPRAYPNPSNGQFTLTGAKGSTAVLRALDGQQIRSWQVTTASERVSMDGMAPGVYFLELVAEGRREVLRVSFVR
ncbi:MAG: T9SS type A sorting domain-containing protein [Flavobacteriales bacterium]|nr:T9SS type A sorting domain-containing protein [Flavobacteriales bacterium]